jgi:hypothetical protein
MRKSQVFVTFLSFAVGFIAATALNRLSSAQPPAPQPMHQEVAVWRYQLTAPTGGAFDGCAILTDTATGHCWWHASFQGAKWEDWGLPPSGSLMP